jgi:hypothetical protein
MPVAFLFIDGLGIGERDPGKNPFAKFPSRFFDFFLNEPLPELPVGGRVLPTAADMAVPGLPQSATGQTALFCGLPAAQITGQHISGFPTPTLRHLLNEHSLFRNLRAAGKSATFANALSHEYFQRRGERISATTRALLAGNFPWRGLDDLRAGRAVSHDLTNEFLRQMGADAPLRTVEESAGFLAEIIAEHDFTLFEFILTDMVGHSQDMAMAKHVIDKLDALLSVILSRLDLRRATIILSSDHGNFEDLATTTHTMNPVPTMVWGRGQSIVAAHVKKIEDLAGAILKICFDPITI